MIVEFQVKEGLDIAVLRDCQVLDESAGQEFLSAVKTRIPQGKKLIVDASAVEQVAPLGLARLLTVNQWLGGAGEKNLVLVGLDNAAAVYIISEAGFVFEFESSIDAAIAANQSQPAPADAAAPASAPAPVPESAPAAPVIEQMPATPARVPQSTAPLKSKYESALPPTSPGTPKSRWADAPPPQAAYQGSQKGYWIPFILVGLIAVVGLAAFYIWKGMSLGGEPTITVSVSKIEVERLGREPDVVEVKVKNGQLSLDEANRELPTGLEFVVESEETDPEQVYTLGGIAGFDSQSKTLNLHGINGARRSTPVTLSIVVKPKPLLWQLESLKSLKLQVGRYIDGFSKFVSGAQSVTADQLPPGIILVSTTPLSKDWQLRGLPTEAVVDFPIKFTATPPTGPGVVESIKMTVAPSAPLVAARTTAPFVPNVGQTGAGVTPNIPGAATVVPQMPPTVVAVTPNSGTPASGTPPTIAVVPVPAVPVPVPVPGTSPTVAVTDPAATPPTVPTGLPPGTTVAAAIPVPQTGAVPAPDEGMRSFMLARIDKLDNRYTDDDRDRLRTVVEYLKESRMIMRVVFEKNGQVTMSDAEKQRLRDNLQSPEVAALIKHDSCQILVVGYADRSGTFASSVRASKKRAASVDKFLKEVIGFNADLCGDYGPTDVVDQSSAANNRAVEIFAGVLDLPANLRPVADRFKEDFNKRHGVHVP